MDLLRFITAGSVDDGKSTLIGRLLYDSKNILIDQLEAFEKSTKNKENGVVEQTRRHSIIASLLKIPHVVVAVNKMDLVEYSQDVFNNIVIDYSEVAKQLGLQDVTYIPISALDGDNIVDRSTHITWYNGKPLLEFLEDVKLDSDINLTVPRFQVQFVIRPQTEDLHDYR